MFENFMSNLKDTSFDKDKEIYLVQNKEICIDFDKYCDSYCRHVVKGNGFLKSVDSVIENNEKVYFIEFKNKNICDALVYDVTVKCYDSLLMYFDKTGQNITQSRDNYYFILVTNNEIEPKTTDSLKKIKKTIKEKANKKWQEFLRKFQSSYFKSIKNLGPVSFNTFLSNEGILQNYTGVK